MKTKIIAGILLALTLVGCGTAYERRGAAGGAAIGALGGYLITGNSKGALIGAGIGGLAGGAIANHKQKRYYRGW